ncbi:MAG: tyrosine-protein phosphatase, partial [Bacilli bacterium]|nr:tyrosine-protein phosphatase [Bacilli bacterium]
MKKSYFLVSAVMALCLCACQNNGPRSSSEPQMEPEKTPTMEVQFKELESNVGVTSEVKTYIDAMHEQEKNITYPHRISYLFGPTDLKKMNDKAETGDNQINYAADETGGVDVCQYLNNKQKYKNEPIQLKWEKGDKDFSEAKVRYWTQLDKSDVNEVAVNADGESASLPNLMRATNYYYQLVDGNDASQMGTFQTADYTRVMTMGDVNNVRDLGGYMTSYGVRTRQGLIFRGYEINEGQFSHSGTHQKTYSEAVQLVAERDMHLGLELDLRAVSGTYQGKQDHSAVEGVEYKRCAINSYAGFITDPNKTSESENADRNLPQEIFEALANAEEKHVYFHCWGGADRTGML